ncbi:hypothetical protein A5882_003669 [Enterococcus sp. 4E1_DIV0656]|uniref:DUF7006 family protein n=1 Tax=Enterococcus sp. 4E1_DIV0656 TaxID=1834180 RepID=UPI000A35F89F|nr:hypothetical protein [Enterococcus sp. 4E1_DIV0656]OTO08990.1 hypothetical protein A5882_003669 [Enterococcus sp. 4E1_DIV0656]
MTFIKTREAYILGYKEILEQYYKDNTDILSYFIAQINQLDVLIGKISQENFWNIWPEILGIDARLGSLTELISYGDFEPEEIIRLVENDYQSYFKELCGYNLNMEPKHSMIFNIR